MDKEQISDDAALAMRSTHSVLRERIVEHIFVGQALKKFWKKGITDVEVLRSEFDAHGYDLVMSRGLVVRHIQFKTGLRDKPANVSVGQLLANKPGGCVVWICVSRNLDLKHFWFFGGDPGDPLPVLDQFDNPKRIGRNAEGQRPRRRNHHAVPVREFRRLHSLDDLLKVLFGDLKPGYRAQAPLASDR